MTNMSTEEKIQQVIKEQGIEATIKEVHKPSKVYGPRVRCFEVKIPCFDNPKHYRRLYAYLGNFVPNKSLAYMLESLVTIAEDYSGLETFECWKMENEDMIHEIGITLSRAYYNHCRKVATDLIYTLGVDTYKKLENIILREA